MTTVRAVFVGAESTGTTTTSRAVQRELAARGGAWSRTQWVPEYGREYTVRKREQAGTLGDRQYEVPWTHGDFVAIAEEQQRIEDAAAAISGPVVCCDTDALATVIWERRYLAEAASMPLVLPGPDRVYFVTQPEGVPFVPDDIRDSENLREWMTRAFEDALDQLGARWFPLTGTVAARVAAAVARIDEALSAKGLAWAQDDVSEEA